MAGHLREGREAFDRRAWGQAYRHLTAADAVRPLDADDLERLAAAAHLIGRRPESRAAWMRAHRDCVRRGQAARAARCGFWLAFDHLHSGEPAQGGGWIDRSRRLIGELGADCAERGLLDLAAALRSVFSGDVPGGYAGLCELATLGERVGDAELVALARVSEGRCLIYLGRVAEGVALLVEAMVAVGAGDVSAIAVGDVYCTAIEGYQELFDVGRAREWTAALSAWCEAQPELVLYRGQCLIHRAELFVLTGAWDEASAEAQRACERLAELGHMALAAATYLRAELYRLRGEIATAEDAYRRAGELGRDPQPGLALLRLAQGRTTEAAVAIRRVWQQAQDPLSRARLAAAYTEILLAQGEVADAGAAAQELAALPDDLARPYLQALGDHLTGSVHLADGEPARAFTRLKRAWDGWCELGATYDAARCRVQLGLACRALGDEAGARLEFESARAALAGLGAVPDVARIDALLRPEAPRSTDMLTARELEVLLLVARGGTNRDIARELVISEKTVASHLSHMFAKLDLPSRAAATAYAYEHGLIG